jgi:3-dehydroshikimate dehydratase
VSFLRYNICSISFRHELVSFRDLVRFAHDTGFSGIELWGVHAKSLLSNHPSDITRLVKEMEQDDVHVSMISDYVNLLAEPAHFPETERKWSELIDHAKWFQTDKIRIFAGNMASGDATEEDWTYCTTQLKRLAERASYYGIYTIIETHPATFADTLDSTLRIIRQTDHNFLRINLDFLHIWESGCEPLVALHKLMPWTMNYHLKNVQGSSFLHVFEPNNVYSPSGCRDGMVALADGVVDYASVIHALLITNTPYSASLEWFGSEPHLFLPAELSWLKEQEATNKYFNTANMQ